LANKTIIAVAVLILAVVCIAGAYVIFNNGDSKESVTINAAGSTTVEPLMVGFQEEYEKQHKNVSINVSAAGSGTAAPALRNGTAHIGMLSRELNASESDLRPIVIAGDCVVIIVDKRAGVTNLSLEQLAKIYKGDYKNWKEVGGNDLAISPIIRESTSGTRTCIDEAMAGVLKVSVTDLSVNYSKYSTQGSTGAMQTQVKNVQGSIGYVNLGNIPSLDSATQVVSINGVMPSKTSALDGTYKVSRNLLLATIGEPTGEIKAFLDWILSPKGQKIVEKEGFVPVGPTS
jgi:phosphate transport system substrate-binding protein